MSYRDYYPAGAADDPNAPYNQVDPEAVEVDVVVSTTLSKSTSVKTTDYIAEEWEDWDTSDEGETIHTGGVDYYYNNCNFVSDYNEEHLTIPEILKRTSDYLLDYMELLKEEYAKTKSNNLRMKIEDIEWLIDEASDWVEDEIEVTQE